MVTHARISIDMGRDSVVRMASAYASRTALAGVAALCFTFPLPLGSQQVEPDFGEDDVAELDEAPRLYLDCRRCDTGHIRREIDFVNHVRDPGAAEVHVLVTDERTGGGGRRFTLDFMGRQDFAGTENSLSFVSPQSSTAAEEREGLTRMLKLGLVPYVAQTGLASALSLSFDPPEEGAARPVDDPWNSWTFEVYGGGNADTETNRSAWNARYGFFASRVTEEWKIQLRPYFNHNVRNIVREDDDDIRSNQRRHGFNSHVIRSLGDHWGAGVFARYSTTTIDNLEHGFTLTPAVEYSIFPYEEASRRQITFTYRIGYEVADYIEETIYGQTAEALLNQSLRASVQYRQPWGSIYSSLTGSRYFHEGDHHRLTADGNVSFRLGGGVSLDVGGTYQRINDQLSLPRGDATLEDLLLEQRRLATSYRAGARIGLSYTFGSIFTNVVNPRF